MSAGGSGVCGAPVYGNYGNGAGCYAGNYAGSVPDPKVIPESTPVDITTVRVFCWGNFSQTQCVWGHFEIVIGRLKDMGSHSLAF